MRCQGNESYLRADMRHFNSLLILSMALWATRISAQSPQSKELLQRATAYASQYPDSAIILAEEVIGLDENVASRARAHAVIGEAYQNQSRLKESIEYFLRAIQIAEEGNDQTTLASTYNGLGISYYYLNEWTKAEEYIRKAAELKLSQGEFTWYSVILINLAGLYSQQGKFEEAITMLHETKNVLVKNNQESYLSPLYNSLGAAYQTGYNNLDSAEYYYSRSIELAETYQLVNNLVSSNYNLAEIAVIRQNYPRALDYLAKAERAADSIPQDRFMIEVYRLSADAHAALGHFGQALDYRTKQLALTNSVFDSDKQKAISELEIQYETTRREKDLQKAQLIAEKKRAQLQVILFVAVTLILLAAFIAFYFWQKRRVHALVEREKTRMFENIVHEIRTPLTLINGPLHLIQQSLDNRPELTEHFRLVQSNSEKLTRLVSELLDASKLEKGHYRLDWYSGDVVAMLRSTALLFQQEANAHSIELRLDLPVHPTFCSYPSNALEKILSNLVSNAIKYSPQHSIVLLSARCEGGVLLLTVADNGPGIPLKDQSRIFGRFYRLPQHEALAGTGIGLSLARELAELAGGQLTLESSPDNGSTFSLRLPLREAQAEAPEDEPSEDERPLLLLVEDDPDITQFVSSLMRSNYRIASAQNGEHGLQLARKILPDIVLTDILMPVKDGIAMLQELKSADLTNHIPVVVFSARASLESRLSSLQFGADAYVPKPFNPKELLLVIQNLLTTVQRNRERYTEKLASSQPAEDRLKSSSDFVNQTVAFIFQHLEESEYGVHQLASDLALSRSQLHRKLTSLTGFSAANFIRIVRLEKAHDLLLETEKNVTEVAFSCGFNSQSYFTKSFAEYFGKTPSGVSNRTDK